MRFRGSTLLFNLIVVGLIFPYEATVIPLYYDFLNYHPAGINLAGSYWALILPQIGQSVTLGTFWMRAFFLTTPRALVEAGRIDGAGSLPDPPQRAPTAGPAGDAHALLLVFIYTWNEFLLALVLLAGLGQHDRAARPLVLRRRDARRRPDQGGRGLGDRGPSDRRRLPVLQRHFIRGVLAGAIKE